MKTGSGILQFAGVICIPIYIVFTFVSHLYNNEINPLTNWLSDFGNPLINPSGAIAYNIGCIVVAALLIVFYIGLCQWYINKKTGKKYIICYICAQISGIIAAVFLVLASIFPLGTHTDLHSIFSMLNMIGMNCFMSFTAIAFLMNPNIHKWIGIYGYLIAVFNIITTNAFSAFYIAEWIYFLLFMIYVAIITLKCNKIIQYGVSSGKQDRKILTY